MPWCYIRAMANPTHKSAEEVFEQVRQLDPEEREKLEELLAAENESKFFATPEIEQAWNDEIDRREQLFLAGEMPLVDADEVFRNARKILAE